MSNIYGDKYCPEPDAITAKRPTVVVTYNILFGAVTLTGDSIVSEEVIGLVREYTDRGYYILIDCASDLMICADRLTEYSIHYDGLTLDGMQGYDKDAERFVERIDSHCGFKAVAVVIDEDILRLKLASELGASAIQVQSGCIIGQQSSGKARTIVPTYKSTYSAGCRA